MAFHLRPVSDRSTSPSTSTSTTSERSPPRMSAVVGPPRPSTPGARPRRPLTPSTLRELDLSMDVELAQRPYPAPPTGHELMALFPPAAPVMHVRPGPTSGYFEREERAFFAKAGKEIVRVRIEIDMPPGAEAEDKARARDPAGAPRLWPAPHPHAHPHSPHQLSPGAPPPMPFPHTAGRVRAPPVPVTPQTVFPAAPKGHPGPPSLNPHPPADMPHPPYVPRPPHELRAAGAGPQGDGHGDEARDDPDESWRRPMPHNERRRAGKHTKRVIVK